MLSSIFYGLAHVSNIIFNIATLLVFVSVGISWFDADPRNRYVRLVRSLTEPMFRPFRRLTARYTGPMDISPFLLMLVIVFLEKVIPTYLMSLSLQMR